MRIKALSHSNVFLRILFHGEYIPSSLGTIVAINKELRLISILPNCNKLKEEASQAGKVDKQEEGLGRKELRQSTRATKEEERAAVAE